MNNKTAISEISKEMKQEEFLKSQDQRHYIGLFHSMSVFFQFYSISTDDGEEHPSFGFSNHNEV